MEVLQICFQLMDMHVNINLDHVNAEEVFQFSYVSGSIYFKE